MERASGTMKEGMALTGKERYPAPPKAAGRVARRREWAGRGSDWLVRYWRNVKRWDWSESVKSECQAKDAGGESRLAWK